MAAKEGGVAMEEIQCRVGFIGGGKMAQAIANGIIAAKMISPSNVCASARTDETLSKWTALGASGTKDNPRIVQECKIVFLCVKPYLIGNVLEEIYHVTTDKQIFVSVAAGVPIEFMEEKLPKGSKVIRTIPNTPCLVQSGVIAYTPGTNCSTGEVTIVHQLLSSVALAEKVPEGHIDVISSLCGSSVAWFYMMIEAASDGAVKVGLPRKLATELAARAMVGAGNMVLKTGRHPGELKDDVTSPGGSTIVGIHSLEKDKVRGSLMTAVELAYIRNREMNPKSK